MGRKQVPSEALLDLRRRLSALRPRSQERRLVLRETAQLYGLSESTLYRALREMVRPRGLRRSDQGVPRVLPRAEMERFCEVIAAMKIRTTNRQGRHLSTSEALRLLEEYGVDTPDGFVRASAGTLKKTTVNRYLRQWGYDLDTLTRQPPAVRFQAHHSNDCWHFDLSPSDLKHIEAPPWVDPEKGEPTLMLFSVVDDRSGVAFQEYRCVYGEEVGAALRFLFAAMSPKKDDGLPFQGIPQMLYMDSGPIARGHVFQQVMRYLGVDVRTHLPQGKNGRRQTARAKGKVERPFRTVKEMHETLYHFHAPQTEDEANAWLVKFLIRYSAMQHRSAPHSRMEDWLENLPPGGFRQMCSWERFCTFAREPERRKVGADARVTVDGVHYEVDPDLVEEEVILWWGLFDHELYVEHSDRRYGPYSAVGGPIPLHRYRSFKKSRTQQRADRIEALAKRLVLPRAALEGEPSMVSPESAAAPSTPFVDPDPFQELAYPNVIAAKRAISAFLRLPLARLPPEELAKIDAILAETMKKTEVLSRVKQQINLP